MTAVVDECRLSRLTVGDHTPFALLPFSSHNLTREIAARVCMSDAVADARVSGQPSKQVAATLVEDI